MICPICGFNEAINGSRCGDCGFYITGTITEKDCGTQIILSSESKTEISGLEKIEPFKEFFWNVPTTGAAFEISNKLNEVIEKVNLMMEVMNKGVK